MKVGTIAQSQTSAFDVAEYILPRGGRADRPYYVTCYGSTTSDHTEPP
ncbi:hypothetical protein ACIQVK_18890 [Streptomyces sp. NPDC090493]